MKKKYIAVLLCAVLFCGLMGCASTEAPQNSANGSASLLQEATNWFESQTSKYVFFYAVFNLRNLLYLILCPLAAPLQLGELYALVKAVIAFCF